MENQNIFKTHYYDDGVAAGKASATFNASATNIGDVSDWSGHGKYYITTVTSSTPINISYIPGYKNLTNDNFYYVVSSYNLPGEALSNHIDTSQISYVAASVSYNSSNGVLTVTPAALYFYTNWDGGEMSARRQTTISTYVYLIK